MKIHSAVSEFIYICTDGRTDSLILIDASQVYKRVYRP